MSGIRVSGSINAYMNKNAAELLGDVVYIGGNINLAETGLERFPCPLIKKIGGDVFISKNAPASLLNELASLQSSGILEGSVVVYGSSEEKIMGDSEGDVFSTNYIASLLCFTISSRIQIFDSEMEFSEADFDELERELESKEPGIIDILGMYFPATNRIELYVNKIQYVSQKIGCSFLSLYNVVKVHEICHAVQHLGTNQRGDFMSTEDFQGMPIEIIEPLAQYWTWIVIVRIRSDRCVKAFFSLDEISPKHYRDWRVLSTCHPEIIRFNWIAMREDAKGFKRLQDLIKRPEYHERENVQSKLNDILGCPAVYASKNGIISGKTTGVVLCAESEQLGGYLDLTGCTKLKNLGNLSQSGDINCGDCVELTSLGDLKTVKGDLELSINSNYCMISKKL